MLPSGGEAAVHRHHAPVHPIQAVQLGPGEHGPCPLGDALVLGEGLGGLGLDAQQGVAHGLGHEGLSVHGQQGEVVDLGKGLEVGQLPPEGGGEAQAGEGRQVEEIGPGDLHGPGDLLL